MRRTQGNWSIWVAAVAGAVAADLGFALRQLWLEPRAHNGDLVWWLDLPLGAVPYGLLMLALCVPALAAARMGPPPWAFVVRPGRFVAPPALWLRVISVEAAVAAWGMVPVIMLSWRIVAPGDSLRVPGVTGVLLALAATVIAWRVRRRTVTLTPEGLTVREVWDTEITQPWDQAASELVADPRSLRWIDARFLTRVVDHYWADPTHRAAIGTAEEHQRLTELLGPRTPSVTRTRSVTRPVPAPWIDDAACCPPSGCLEVLAL
ncbi:hypothetical protein [Dactylosporangium cerinum]